MGTADTFQVILSAQGTIEGYAHVPATFGVSSMFRVNEKVCAMLNSGIDSRILTIVDEAAFDVGRLKCVRIPT